MVRTPPFHGGNMGSNPVGVTKNTRYTSVYRVFFMTHRDEPAAVNDEERVKRRKKRKDEKRGRFAVANPPRERNDRPPVEKTNQSALI